MKYVLNEVQRHFPSTFPGTLVEIQAAICKLPIKSYMSCFEDHELTLAKQALAAIKNAHLKGHKSIVSEVMTAVAKEGLYVYRGNRWHDVDKLTASIVRRDLDKVQKAAEVLQFVLSVQPLTCPEIIKMLHELNLKGEIRAKFALDGSGRAQHAALMRILNYMQDEAHTVKRDKVGHGARWELI